MATTISLKWWDKQRPEDVKTKDLDKALAAAASGKAEDLAAVERAIAPTRRLFDKKAHKDALSALDDLEKEVGKAMKTAAASGAEDEEGEPVEEGLLKPERIRAALKAVDSGTPHAFAAVLGADKAAVLVFHKSKKPANLLGWLKKQTGESQAVCGTASADPDAAGRLLLRTEQGRLAGLAKRVKDYLKDNKPLPFTQCVVVGADGSREEDGEAAAAGETIAGSTRFRFFGA